MWQSPELFLSVEPPGDWSLEVLSATLWITGYLMAAYLLSDAYITIISWYCIYDFNSSTTAEVGPSGYNKLTNSQGDCTMFRRSYVQKVLCSENIYSKGSMFRKIYIQKILCSEGPIFRKYLFKRSYIEKVLYSVMFRRSYIQKSLCFIWEKTYIIQFQGNYHAR